MKTEAENWGLRNGILIVLWTRHVAMGQSIHFSVFCVYETGIVSCQHYLINEQSVSGKYRILYKC